MYVGIFGDVIFSVGHLRTLTLSNFKGSTGAEWVEHKVINGKAKPGVRRPEAQGVHLRYSAGCRPWRESAQDAETLDADGGRR